MTARGQDLHFSDYSGAALQLNPALTGFIPGTAPARLQVAYRNQWISALAENSFNTIAASFDKRFCITDGLGFWSLGVSAYHDVRGEASLSTSGFQASGAFTRRINRSKKNPTLITVAVEGGAIQNAINPRNRTFDEQFDDPSIPDEVLNLSSSIIPDLGVGVFFSRSLKYPTWLDVLNLGLAVKHLTRPAFEFIDAGQAKDTRLPMRTNAQLGVIKEFAKTRLNLSVLYSHQNPHDMLLIRALLTMRTNQTWRYGFGAGFRWNSDLNGVSSETGVATLRMQREELSISISYDVNFGPISGATSGTGAFELSFSRSIGGNNCVNCPYF